MNYKMPRRNLKKGLTKTEVAQVKRIVHTTHEPKRFDYTDYNAASVLVSGTGWKISDDIVKGTGPNQRDGDIVHLKGLKLKYQWNKHATPSSQMVRMIIYRDFNNNGANPDILEAQKASSYPCIGQLDTHENKIYYDKSILLHSDRPAAYVDTFVDFKNEKFEYVSGTNDGTKGAIYVSIVSDNLTNGASLIMSGTMYFKG